MILPPTLSINQLFSSNISSSDIDVVKKSEDREAIGNFVNRLFDKVADWFCGTNRVEAKKYIFDLFSPAISDAVKIESFEALKNLAGAGYQDRFIQTNDSDKKTYSLNFGTGEDSGKFSLELEFIKCDKDLALKELRSDRSKEKLQEQLEKDIKRSDYSVAGKPLSKGTLAERLAQFHQELNALNCTPGEAKSIIEVCNQSSIAMLMLASTPQGETAANCPCGDGTIVSFQISREDGKIHVQAQYSKDISAASTREQLENQISMVNEVPAFKKSIEANINISIDTDGKFDIISFNSLANNTAREFGKSAVH
jgi:hypothetical protein